MKIMKNVPLVCTDKIEAQKAFYCEHFDFRPTFDSGEFLGLVSLNGSCEISFMTPTSADKQFQSNENIAFCLAVDDVDEEHARLTAEGVKFIQPPKDNPWGDRSAIAVDPSGIKVYIYKMIPPGQEYAGYFRD